MSLSHGCVLDNGCKKIDRTELTRQVENRDEIPVTVWNVKEAVDVRRTTDEERQALFERDGVRYSVWEHEPMDVCIFHDEEQGWCVVETIGGMGHPYWDHLAYSEKRDGAPQAFLEKHFREYIENLKNQLKFHDEKWEGLPESLREYPDKTRKCMVAKLAAIRTQAACLCGKEIA